MEIGTCNCWIGVIGVAEEIEKYGAKWIVCDEDFIEADVVLFEESVWEKGQRRRAVRVGKREVVAQVLEDEGDQDGWVYLKVIKSAMTEVFRKTLLLAEGEEVWRRRRSIIREGVLRLEWSDESARDCVALDLEPSKRGSDRERTRDDRADRPVAPRPGGWRPR